MSKAKSILAYLWAGLSVPILLVMVFGLANWSELLVNVTGVTISPWFSGGEVVRTVAHDGYKTHIHRPVFDALIGERREGFVQVDWTPRAALPAQVAEEIDYDGDGRADFHIELDTQTGQAELTPLDERVIGLQGTYQLEEAWVARVNLLNLP